MMMVVDGAEMAYALFELVHWFIISFARTCLEKKTTLIFLAADTLLAKREQQPTAAVFQVKKRLHIVVHKIHREILLTYLMISAMFY